MSEAEVKVFVGERCEEILLEVAEILGVKSPEEVLEAVQRMVTNPTLETPKEAVGERRVPWVRERRALVRWAATGKHDAGDWFEGVARMHEGGDVEGPAVVDADYCRAWVYDLDNFVPDDDADTRPLPDHCGTCFLSFGCGCPGDGWSVPVHVKLPEVAADVGLHLAAGAGLHGWESGGQWRVNGYERKPGATCRPVVPFRNGIPIYLKPWGQP